MHINVNSLIPFTQGLQCTDCAAAFPTGATVSIWLRSGCSFSSLNRLVQWTFYTDESLPFTVPSLAAKYSPWGTFPLSFLSTTAHPHIITVFPSSLQFPLLTSSLSCFEFYFPSSSASSSTFSNLILHRTSPYSPVIPSPSYWGPPTFPLLLSLFRSPPFPTPRFLSFPPPLPPLLFLKLMLHVTSPYSSVIPSASSWAPSTRPLLPLFSSHSSFLPLPPFPIAHATAYAYQYIPPSTASSASLRRQDTLQSPFFSPFWLFWLCRKVKLVLWRGVSPGVHVRLGFSFQQLSLLFCAPFSFSFFTVHSLLLFFCFPFFIYRWLFDYIYIFSRYLFLL